MPSLIIIVIIMWITLNTLLSSNLILVEVNGANVSNSKSGWVLEMAVRLMMTSELMENQRMFWNHMLALSCLSVSLVECVVIIVIINV